MRCRTVFSFPCMLLAQSLNPTFFPQASRFAANLAGAKGFLLGGFDTATNVVVCMVHIEAQPPKLFFHLQDFKFAADFLLQFLDRWFQVLA